jgi:outer membrane protein
MRAVAWAGTLIGSVCAVGSAGAADIAQPDGLPVLAADAFQPFFVKFGFTYGLHQSYSKLWAQNPVALLQGNPSAFPAGIGTSIGNIPTFGVEVGWYLSRNISLNVSGGVPFFVDVKTKGFNPANPVVTNGTVLAQTMPGLVPITALYHFDGFGAFRPYVGGGLASAFSLGNKNAFLTGVHIGSSLGLVVQAGADYMVTRDWGVTFDVKKTFDYVESEADGVNVPGVGLLPARTYQHTHFQPWAFSVGLIYRFGQGWASPLF